MRTILVLFFCSSLGLAAAKYWADSHLQGIIYQLLGVGYKRLECEKPPNVTGHCKASFQRYTYNTKRDSCDRFIYGGCGGNANNFLTKDECNAVCSRRRVKVRCLYCRASYETPAKVAACVKSCNLKYSKRKPQKKMAENRSE